MFELKSFKSNFIAFAIACVILGCNLASLCFTESIVNVIGIACGLIAMIAYYYVLCQYAQFKNLMGE